MTSIILAAIVGAAIGAVLVIVAKLNFSTGWSNKEFDGTMFIGMMLLAYIGTLFGTYLNPAFAALETTKMAFDTFENLFMIIVGYLFKKAVDTVASGTGSGGVK